ncbi:hypothetical protein [Pelagerythrobacter aerophilus]|uniref:Uncharacterized protein n=1 Tax=Pelagerythrobacter aerophilus TaxID=2306995 RepID=A0A418NK39_9SPHN|nr:hypothetical protein [Pelagerythrobacter aerophilus]RIV79594.1 hypothetical protein D2V04_06390 [Pelagerythrobacter aerophilus]
MRDIGWPNELPDPSFTADRPGEEKGRYLRALYRASNGAEQHRIVLAEYARLYGREKWDLDLSYIVKDSHTEGRELKGQRYDQVMQTWVWPDGELVRYKGDEGV